MDSSGGVGAGPTKVHVHHQDLQYIELSTPINDDFDMNGLIDVA